MFLILDINSKDDEWSLVIDKINFSESNSSLDTIFNIQPPLVTINPPERPASVSTLPTVLPFKVVDQSYGNGAIVLQLNQKVYGVGASVKACTNPMSRYHVACKNDSDFQILTVTWGLVPMTPLQMSGRKNINVTADGYPFGDYFTRFILPDGTQREAIFSPTRLGGEY